MIDINTILAKHFSGESSSQEERLVQEFKRKNIAEYNSIKALWSSNNLKITKFDTSAAWDNIEKESTRTEPKATSKKTRNLLIVAILMLSVLAGAYLLMNGNSSGKTIELKALENGEMVLLADGSKISLRKDAVLSYPKKFGEKSREIRLEGEAFFDIERDPNKPFIVHTIHSDIEVLGTSFNINADAEMSKVTVATGKVKVKNSDHTDSTILTPNQSAVVAKSNILFSSTSDKNELAWMSGKFEFDNTELRKVVDDLNSYYGNKIKLSNTVGECSFNSSFDQEKLTTILKIIQLSCGLELTQKNGNYELH